MADNHSSWRVQGPRGMSAVIYSRPCGWHVLLSSTGPTMESRLRPHIIGKACVPYSRTGADLNALDQLQSMVIGLHMIWSNEPGECDNL